MTAENQPATPVSTARAPAVGASYNHGWRQLWKYPLELLLIMVITLVISSPSGMLNAAREAGGAATAGLGFIALVYNLLVMGPVDYGSHFAMLLAARDEAPDIKDILQVFQNWLNAVLANLLAGAIVIIGFALLIVPGIIFACKLAFVPYLVVERKMEAIEAVKESWRMTRGYTGKIFLLGLLAIPIVIAGLLCLGVGVIVSMVWIRLALASLYHAVSLTAGTAKQ